MKFISEALHAPNISTLSVQMYLMKFIPEVLRAPNISTLSVQMYLLKFIPEAQSRNIGRMKRF
jgi:hypothetical protein